MSNAEDTRTLEFLFALKIQCLESVSATGKLNPGASALKVSPAWWGKLLSPGRAAEEEG